MESEPFEKVAGRDDERITGLTSFDRIGLGFCAIGFCLALTIAFGLQPPARSILESNGGLSRIGWLFTRSWLPFVLAAPAPALIGTVVFRRSPRRTRKWALALAVAFAVLLPLIEIATIRNAFTSTAPVDP